MPVWFANFQLIEQFALVQSTALFCAPHLSSLSATITSDGRRASTDRPPAGSARHGAHKNHTRRPTRPSCFTERTPRPCHFAETKRDVCERVRWRAASRASRAGRRRRRSQVHARTYAHAREHLSSAELVITSLLPTAASHRTVCAVGSSVRPSMMFGGPWVIALVQQKRCLLILMEERAPSSTDAGTARSSWTA